MTKVLDVIVIGGGQAGLASGYHLQKKGLQFLILESQENAEGSWPQYYDSLKLFSPARFSPLPGMNFPGDPDHYPSKSEVIRYLKDYQDYFQFPLVTNSHVVSVEKKDHIFTIQTKSNEVYLSRSIINATGSFHTPFIPSITGMDQFKGHIIHSADYRSPDTLNNQRIVVVGSRNSAVQIAIELAEVSSTTLAVRHPVKLINQKIIGKDLHFWFKIIGFDTFPFWRFGKMIPSSNAVIDLDGFKEQLAMGKPNQKPMFSSFYTEGIIWSDGIKEPVDTVIFATGYRYNFPYLRQLRALDSEGKPLHLAGVSKTVPGLYYLGLEGQRSFSSATLRGVDSDAKFVVRRLLTYLKAQ
ncbi:putative flavoprotein involved in K+ transport [Bacillus oleivorans]|uniref:Putative flavoprotein involved in K+ transport n=1 Tax=Bacillus oleivorans TaxID=1448271 RepID=A0A285CY77_9BACI|nr:NAD(P)/FAD-dependent oxidoreductase [Bacillus oleivorans]SNX72512.1 putative flavoprotein involved in K+ transport [Bacillus oleivorans]